MMDFIFEFDKEYMYKIFVRDPGDCVRVLTHDLKIIFNNEELRNDKEFIMDCWKQYCRQVVILDLKESFMEVKKYKRKYNKLFKLDKSDLIIREEDEKLFVHEFIYCLDNEI